VNQHSRRGRTPHILINGPIARAGGTADDTTRPRSRRWRRMKCRLGSSTANEARKSPRRRA